MNLILQPCGRADSKRHYIDTIKNLVEFRQFRKELEGEYETLENLFPSGKVAVWGVTRGKNGVNVGKWARIERGDVSLFTKPGGVFSTAIVAHKSHLPEFAEKLWGLDPNGMSWEYVYFLDEVRDLEIPYSLFNATLGYQNNYVVQGFNVLGPEKAGRLTDVFPVESLVHYPEASFQAYKVTMEALQGKELDIERVSLARVEQSYLRKILFHAPSRQCDLCGDEYPISFLIAAHIKKRSACSQQERLDAKNLVMAACTFGCDALFEKGFVSISSLGEISITRKPRVTEALGRHLKSLEGRICGAFSESSSRYFEWHHRNVFLK